MVVPKINSSHGSETRNIINAAIDAINVQGKTVQDLVAKGQLTPARYAELIQTVNGLIAKGEVSVHDIDVNKGKLLPKHLSEEVLKMMTGDAPVNAIPAEGSLTTREYADKSVTPNKTTFIKQTKNLWDGEYYPWYIVGSSDSYRLVREFDGSSNGVVVMAPIKPGVSYTIKVYEEQLSNRFIVGTSKNHPGNFIESFYLDTGLFQDRELKEYTFNNSAGDNWLYVMISNENKKPKIQIEEGVKPSEYTAPYLFPKEYIMPEIKDEIKGMDNTVTLIEDISNGYPPRTNATSVIWIGPNEPTEVEPYDEWRQTEGYTISTDFSGGYGSGTADWRLVWDKNAAINIGISYLTLVGLEGNAYIAISPNKTPSNIQDGEVFVEGYQESLASVQSLAALLRGQNSSNGSYSGYSVGIWADELRIVKYVNGQSTRLGSTPNNLSFDKKIKVLARVEGDTFKAKVWEDGKIEPEWMLEAVDSEFVTGEFGLNNFSTVSNPVEFYRFGLGTNGMRAPRKQLIR